MNDFDFFMVTATSNKIRPMLKMGIPRKHISTRIFYGGRFPKSVHTANLHYVDVHTIGHMNARAEAERLMSYITPTPEVSVHIRFHCAD
jgi:hypothetical protein